MTRPLAIIVALLFALLINSGASAQDGEPSTPYFRAPGFNAPMLASWEDQSSADIAQFHLAEAGATIRTAFVAEADPQAAAEADLADLLGRPMGQPSYSDKVNLADGTWQVRVYDVDAATTASVLARRDDAGSFVISFVEDAPDTRTVMLVISQMDDTLNTPVPEVDRALDFFADFEISQLNDTELMDLSIGQWTLYSRDGLSAMGMVYGNDSYVALQVGESSDLAALADAWTRTLLGFFITPDNSRYLALGLAVTFAVLGLLLLSYGWRSRSIEKDLALIEALEPEKY